MAISPKKTGFVCRTRGVHAFEGINIGGKNVPTQILFAIAQSATQYGTEIQAQVCDSDGNIIPGTYVLDFWLSDAADGIGMTATDPFGTVGAKAGAGVVLFTGTAKKSFRAVTKADGTFTLSIIDDATPVLLYAAASLPSIGLIGVSRKTIAGDYKP